MPSPNKTQRSPSSRPPHQRNRSASDPFLDPVYPAPYLPYRDDAHPRSVPTSNQIPQVPPKQVVRKTRQSNDIRDPRMLEAAVREAVTVRPVDSPRARVARSQTGFVILNSACSSVDLLDHIASGVQTSASSSKPAPAASRRSYSQDSVTQAANNTDRSRKTGKTGTKKGSSHADVIDRMDFTGVGPSAYSFLISQYVLHLLMCGCIAIVGSVPPRWSV